MSKTPDCLYLIRNVYRWQEHMAHKTSHRRHRAKVLVGVEMWDPHSRRKWARTRIDNRITRWIRWKRCWQTRWSLRVPRPGRPHRIACYSRIRTYESRKPRQSRTTTQCYPGSASARTRILLGTLEHRVSSRCRATALPLREAISLKMAPEINHIFRHNWIESVPSVAAFTRR